jgi:alginate O-acetyltransferase complex protein AlgJ
MRPTAAPFAVRLRVLLFAFVLVTPASLLLLGFDGGDQRAENRTLNAFPRLDGSVASLAAFGPGVQAWFNDHFGLRSTFIRWHGISRYAWLHMSPMPHVLLGADGWLFYAEDGAIEDMAQAEPFTADELAAWRATVTRTRDWLQARGIAYVFTVAPDKHAIYPEAIPPTVRRIGHSSRTDQLLEALADTGVTIDVRPALLEAKPRERLYHQTDTHWNARGAYAAYGVLVDRLHGARPGVPAPWPRSDFEETERQTLGRDLAGMLGLTYALGERDLGLRPIRARRAQVIEPAGEETTGEVGRLVVEVPDAALPRAVIFRDSFTVGLAPFLSEHFSRAVFLWQNTFDADVVIREHADVVVQEIVGRHLYGYVPTPELVPSP